MAKGKKVAARGGSKKSSKTVAKKDWKSQHSHLFVKKARNFKIGRDVQPKRDLSRFVKWPRYIRIQRQRAILKKRLKIPPALNHLSQTLEKNQAAKLFKLLSHYRPESAQQKKARQEKAAAAEANGEDAGKTKKPKFVKHGLNHITSLVENRKAKLVVIAHDVDPVELVVWLPALCRKKDIPYCIVKGKARLGRLVHQKTATAVALTDLRKEDAGSLEQFISNVRPMYNDSTTCNSKWGTQVMGVKTTARLRIRDARRAKENAMKIKRM